MKKLFTLFLVVFYTIQGYSQTGGLGSFAFVGLPVNGRVAALGGIQVSPSEADPNHIFYNPGALSAKSDKMLSVNYTPYLGGTNATNLAYTHNSSKLGVVGLGMQYMSYGSITETDEAGNEIGQFRANEYAFSVAHSQTVGPFSLGANLRFAGSQLGSYSAFAVMADMGGVYRHPQHDFVIGMVIRNVGWVMKNYTAGSQSYLPLNVHVGASYKPEHMPVRLSLTAINLTNYDTPENAYLQVSNASQQKQLSVADKIARHAIIGAEIIFSKNFQGRVAYNFQRRQMKLEEKGGAAGLNLGVMARIKAFCFEYAYSVYAVSGGNISTLTLTMDTAKLFRKKVQATSTPAESDQ